LRRGRALLQGAAAGRRAVLVGLAAVPFAAGGALLGGDVQTQPTLVVGLWGDGFIAHGQRLYPKCYRNRGAFSVTPRAAVFVIRYLFRSRVGSAARARSARAAIHEE